MTTTTCQHNDLDLISREGDTETWECAWCSHHITRQHEHAWQTYRPTLPTCTATRGSHIFGECGCPTAEACWGCDATR